MNKTIYLPDEESEIWEKARKFANDRLSPVILKALKDFVVAKEGEASGHERIELKFDDSEDSAIPKIKAFRGKWIFSPSAPVTLHNSDGTKGEHFAVAVTSKGNVVVYTWRTEVETKGEFAGELYTSSARFLVFPSFEEAAKNNDLNYAIRKAIIKRGIPVEELDI